MQVTIIMNADVDPGHTKTKKTQTKNQTGEKRSVRLDASQAMIKQGETQNGKPWQMKWGESQRQKQAEYKIRHEAQGFCFFGRKVPFNCCYLGTHRIYTGK